MIDCVAGSPITPLQIACDILMHSFMTRGRIPNFGADKTAALPLLFGKGSRKMKQCVAKCN
eukprot:11568457-Karenia_brevis.AAC.1